MTSLSEEELDAIREAALDPDEDDPDEWVPDVRSDPVPVHPDDPQEDLEP